MKRVVYTTIFGNYDKLRDPKIIEPNIDYICITDNKKLKSKVRKFLYKTSDVSNKVKNRKYKILAHRYFPEYDQSLYVDGNIQITGNVSLLFDRYLKKNNIAITPHPERKCTYAEFDTCVSAGIVDKNLAKTQKHKYLKEGMPKNLGLFESNIIFRKHKNPKIKKLMEYWFNEIENYTHRDQFSFMYVAWKNGLDNKIGIIEESARFKNKYFKIYPHIAKGKLKLIKNIVRFIYCRRNYNKFIYMLYNIIEKINKGYLLKLLYKKKWK